MWSSSSSSSAIVRPSSQILVCTTRATISSTQTIAFLSSDLVRFLFKPLSSNSSDPRQLFLRKKVRPLLEPYPALPKAHSSSNRQFLLRGIVSTLLVSSSAFWGGYRHRSLGHCHDSLKSELSSWFSPCSQLSPQALFSSVIYTRRKLSLRVSSFCNHRIV
jgi:hypothetical protein